MAHRTSNRALTAAENKAIVLADAPDVDVTSADPQLEDTTEPAAVPDGVEVVLAMHFGANLPGDTIVVTRQVAGTLYDAGILARS